MRVSDLFRESKVLTKYQISLLRTNCSQFFNETNCQPLLKQTPTSTSFSKIKVRFHKKQNEFIDTFNAAFLEKHHISNLHQRAIFASSTPTIEKQFNSVYIFPKNGYKFLYSKEITNSNSEYQIVFEQLFEQIDDIQTTSQIIKDLLKYTYVDCKLQEGIKNRAEIILYNIPYYFAVKTNCFNSYKDLLSALR